VRPQLSSLCPDIYIQNDNGYDGTQGFRQREESKEKNRETENTRV
jgi:hypothetical protein